ncbi:UNVERIFIED_CONTAM: hypothetical protein HDU68_012292 [Siphonaria sp. JEL0065]|nr:hypothetical protein HDU68_012292 [Siphonaria sp. JEL0065]
MCLKCREDWTTKHYHKRKRKSHANQLLASEPLQQQHVQVVDLQQSEPKPSETVQNRSKSKTQLIVEDEGEGELLPERDDASAQSEYELTVEIGQESEPESTQEEYPSWFNIDAIPKGIFNLDRWDDHVQDIVKLDNKKEPDNTDHDRFRTSVIWKEGVLNKDSQKLGVPAGLMRKKCKDKRQKAPTNVPRHPSAPVRPVSLCSFIRRRQMSLDKWHEIGKRLTFSNIPANSSVLLKEIYVNYILDFERVLAVAEGNTIAQKVDQKPVAPNPPNTATTTTDMSGKKKKLVKKRDVPSQEWVQEQLVELASLYTPKYPLLVVPDSPGDLYVDEEEPDKDYDVESILGHSFDKYKERIQERERLRLNAAKNVDSSLPTRVSLNPTTPAAAATNSNTSTPAITASINYVANEKRPLDLGTSSSGTPASTAASLPVKSVKSGSKSISGTSGTGQPATPSGFSEPSAKRAKTSETTAKVRPSLAAIPPPPAPVLAKMQSKTAVDASTSKGKATSKPTGELARPPQQTLPQNLLSHNQLELQVQEQQIYPPWFNPEVIPAHLYEITSWDHLLVQLSKIDNEGEPENTDENRFRAAIVFKQGILNTESNLPTRVVVPVALVKRKCKDRVEFLFSLCFFLVYVLITGFFLLRLVD